jgi:16S rRNA (cytidine1402-2'-O)-methyltransferase
MSLGTLYLVPAPLGDAPLDATIPPDVRTLAGRLTHWVVEHPKTARAFIKAYAPTRAIAELQIETLNEHTPPHALAALLAPLEAGHDVGLMSEAGCPGVADPGAELVRLAHTKGISVMPLVGPSSLLLALMASGTCGQRFRFHGYLPVEAPARLERLKTLARDSAKHDEAQLFIETPYRNDALFDAVLAACPAQTLLTVARDLTTAEAFVATRTVEAWQRTPRPDLKKRPTVFVLYTGR